MNLADDDPTPIPVADKTDESPREIGYKLKKAPALFTEACPDCGSARIYYDPRVLELAGQKKDLALTCGCGARLLAKHRVIVTARQGPV